MSAAELAFSVAERGFLAEVDARWAEDERRRLEEARLRALECLAACGLGLGGSRLSTTQRAARRPIEAAPYRETGYRFLIEALAERGRVAEALQVFDDARRLLHAELGVAPSAGLRSMHERLLSEQGPQAQSQRDDPLAVSSATVTALFTDLVCDRDIDSGVVDELRDAHVRLLRQAVAAQAERSVREMAGWPGQRRAAAPGSGACRATPRSGAATGRRSSGRALRASIRARSLRPA